MKFYTGIGARKTPTDIIDLMTEIAMSLEKYEFILRSGGAEGADAAFEAGCSNKRIYLPWNGFNSKYADSVSYTVPNYNEEWVEDYHPNTSRLSAKGYKLMSRNTYQVLGDDLNTPSKFVICWTKDGKASGGTGQALRIAKDYNIPIHNLYNKDSLDYILRSCGLK